MKAANTGGIRTLQDLLGRCRLDEETGCMIIEACRRKGTYTVWLPELGIPVALPKALKHLIGKPLQPGQRWVPRCGHTGCCNPAHRFVGTRADLMRILRPTLDPLHRARIAEAHRAREGSLYSPELRDEIIASDESLQQIAARTGLHATHVSRIRRGEAWRQAAPAASVFNLGASR